MDVDDRVIKNFARKLGVGEDVAVITKSSELLRLLSLKKSTLSENDKIILCLDIAATIVGSSIDMDVALKLTRLTTNPYLNAKRNIEKTLGVYRPIEINDICVQLGITHVKNRATELLKQFQQCSVDNTAANSDIYTHPQYATMAIYQTCKQMKIPIQKRKLLMLSCLKPMQWAKWEKFWETQLVAYNAQQLKKPSHEVNANNLENCSIEDSLQTKISRKEAGIREESYEQWKGRILQKAFDDLENLHK